MSTPVTLLFDGHDLADIFVVERHVVRGLPTWEPTLVDVMGRSGAIYAGTRALPPTIELDLYFMDADRSSRMEAVRELAAILAVDEPRPLVFGDEGGLWRMAVPKLEQPLTAYLDADAAHVAFTCPDPWLYGIEREVALSSTTTLRVGGTAPTPIDIEVTGATAGMLTISNATTGETMTVNGITSGATVVAKSTDRTLTINGTSYLLAANSDWLSAIPGNNEMTITSGGGSSVKATITERWW